MFTDTKQTRPVNGYLLEVTKADRKHGVTGYLFDKEEDMKRLMQRRWWDGEPAHGAVNTIDVSHLPDTDDHDIPALTAIWKSAELPVLNEWSEELDTAARALEALRNRICRTEMADEAFMRYCAMIDTLFRQYLTLSKIIATKRAADTFIDPSMS